MSQAPEKTTTMTMDQVFAVAATLQRGDEITAFLRLTAATKGAKDVPDWTVRTGTVLQTVNPTGKDKTKHPYAWISFKDNKANMESFPEDGKHDTKSLTYGRVDVVPMVEPKAPPPPPKTPAKAADAEEVPVVVDPRAPGRQIPITDDLPSYEDDDDLFGDEEIIDREKVFDFNPEVDVSLPSNFMEPSQWVRIIKSKDDTKEMWKAWEEAFKGKGHDKASNAEIDRTLHGAKTDSVEILKNPAKLLDQFFMKEVMRKLWFLQGMINRRTYRKEVCDMMDRNFENRGKAQWIKEVEIETLQQAKIMGLSSSPFLLPNNGGNSNGNSNGNGGGTQRNTGGGNNGGGNKGGGNKGGGNKGGGSQQQRQNNNPNAPQAPANNPQKGKTPPPKSASKAPQMAEEDF